MAPNGLQPTDYTCKCLNIRIHPQPNEATHPPPDGDFQPVYVGDEGIFVAHNEVTLRSRTRPVRALGDSRLTRYMSLTCLICDTLVYRVLQYTSPDLDNDEGPVLPTDDWAEREMLKSSTGWIEVYKDCLTGEAIIQAKSSPLYSEMLGLMLPSVTLSPEPDKSAEIPLPRSPTPQGSSESSGHHLPALPPLFLPPPFTPSHPVFSHLSSVASAESQKIRNAAEEYIVEVTRQKVEEIQADEAELKRQVELVWTKFKQGLEKFEQATPSRKWSGAASRSRHSSTATWGTLSSPAVGAGPASVRIHDFVPGPSPPTRISSASRQHAQSALSTSLATSSFHYPEALRAGSVTPTSRHSSEDSQSPPIPDARAMSPDRSSSTRVMSPSTASSRTFAMPINGEASTIREAYRRNMDEAKDTATSFRYVTDLEANMEEQRRHTSGEDQRRDEASSSHATPSISGSVVARAQSPKAHKSAIKHSSPKSGSSTKDNSSPNKGETTEDHKEGTSKGKRKVTFDVKPEIAIIKNESELELEPEQDTGVRHAEEAIFDMEGEGGERVKVMDEQQADKAKPASELVRAPHRPFRTRSANTLGLPASLSSLRPASLPAPSILSASRPSVPAEENTERSRPQAMRESLLSIQTKAENTHHKVNGHHVEKSRDEPLGPREAEILKLVAASTPSHRSAWKKDSKAWQLFVNRRDRKTGDNAPGSIAEEEDNYHVIDDLDPVRRRAADGSSESESMDDDDSDDKWPPSYAPPIAASLPIPIGPLSQHKHAFGVPSYQPKTSLSDRPGILVPPLRHSSSAAMRKASYAERDRSRLIDPGALDFTEEEDDDDDDDDDEDMQSDAEVGGRARQRALRILQARNEIPAAGMWRSLA